MISFDRIGNLGRLGNQMFQYASLRGIANRHGYEYCLPPRYTFGQYDEKVRKSDITIYECFKLPEVEYKITNYPVLMEPPCEFDGNIWENCPDNINLFGYYQFKTYFENIENDIRDAFTFVDQILYSCKEFFQENFLNCEVISLHVRRTDYLQNIKTHPLQTTKYYEESLSYFPDNLPVLVFSDDIEWCKKQEIFSKDRFLFSENNNTGIDLCLQTLCNYHIIANSSFSWWGSWLSKSKKTIAPKKWSGNLNTDKYLQDMYLSNWIVI